MIRTVALFVVMAALVGILLFHIDSRSEIKPNALPTTRPDLTKLMPPSAKVHTFVQKYSEKYKVPEQFIFRCAKQETAYQGYTHESYNPYTNKMVSIAHAYGPMQVRVCAARAAWGPRLKKVSDAEIVYRLRYDLDFSVETAIKYMRLLYNQTHDWTRTFSAYNQGEIGKTNINSYATNITRKRI